MQDRSVEISSSFNATLWCAISGLATLGIALAFFYATNTLAFPTLVTSFAAGFFVGSMVFCLLNLYNFAQGTFSSDALKLVALSLGAGIVGSIPFFFFKSPAKAAEIGIIISGIACVLVESSLEKRR